MTQAHVLDEISAIRGCFRVGRGVNWAQLVAQDSSATVFQTPPFFLPWYEAYQRLYRPLLVLVTDARGEVVGYVPLAVDWPSGRLTFAGDEMCDYRDVVALPEFRREVIWQMLAVVRGLESPGALAVGPTHHKSRTPGYLIEICREHALGTILRYHTCHRWQPPLRNDSGALRVLRKYQKQGPVELRHVDQRTWAEVRQEFITQHTLRQLQSGRTVTFRSQERRRVYDTLIDEPDSVAHLTVMNVGTRPVAMHFGFLWRRVLHLGAPTIDLRDETQYPGIALMALIMQRASQLGIESVDFTIGESEFKRRLANITLQLPTVIVERSRLRALSLRARDGAVGVVKSATTKVLGRDAWSDRVRPWLRSAAGNLRRPAGSRAGADQPAAYELNTDRLRMQPRGTADVRVNVDAVEDLLDWEMLDGPSHAELQRAVQRFGRSRKAGRPLYTVIASGQLVGWAYGEGHNGEDLAAGLTDVHWLVTRSHLATAAEFLACLVLHVVPDSAAAVKIELVGSRTELTEAVRALGGNPCAAGKTLGA